MFFLFLQIVEKDVQIEKLIKRVTILHELNNEFASEHEKQQRELQSLKSKLDRYLEMEANGCDSCHSLATQNHELQQETIELKEQQQKCLSKIALQNDDNHMMKVLIYRLNAQLENYQQTMCKTKTDTNAEHRNENVAVAQVNIASIDWGCMRTNVLAPLLNAYHETIKEKVSLIHQYDVEMNKMTGRLKDMSTDNDQMYIDMEQLRRKSDGWITEKARLQAQLNAYK